MPHTSYNKVQHLAPVLAGWQARNKGSHCPKSKADLHKRQSQMYRLEKTRRASNHALRHSERASPGRRHDDIMHARCSKKRERVTQQSSSTHANVLPTELQEDICSGKIAVQHKTGALCRANHVRSGANQPILVYSRSSPLNHIIFFFQNQVKSSSPLHLYLLGAKRGSNTVCRYQHTSLPWSIALALEWSCRPPANGRTCF